MMPLAMSQVAVRMSPLGGKATSQPPAIVSTLATKGEPAVIDPERSHRLSTTAVKSRSRSDILIYAEKVCRVIFLLQLREALVIIPVTRLHACLAFVVHHEVDIAAA